MERENFYLLLELSIDPPEEDYKIIEGTIKKKQAEWSRSRNHPTKGIQAQQHIGLIPEIREVMADSDLREKEALEAKNILQRKDREKYSKIDRHLRIYISKGHVTDDEIIRLSKLHSIHETDIRNRIKKNEENPILETYKFTETDGRPLTEEEKFSEIDKHIVVRVIKGFITDEEISKLAKLHSVKEQEIRERVKCPIKKDDKGEVESPEPLDKSIENAINENLKVVGKSSLYEFLELSQSASLNTIQQTAETKRSEILTVGKKTAISTASGELSGHCIAVFKTQETRLSYDINRAYSFLAILNSDIDAAEADGIIQPSYFEVLIKLASEFGMDEKEAIKYIEKYCHEKEWTIKSFRKLKRLLIIAAAALIVLIIISAGTAIILHINEIQRVNDEFQKAMAKVEYQKILDKKEKILLDFLNSVGKKTDAYYKAEKKIGEIREQIKKRNLIRERDYITAVNKTGELQKSNKLEEAIAVYKNYLAKYPDTAHADKIEQYIAEISSQFDDQKYRELIKAARKAGTKSLYLYINFLETYPNSKYQEDVKKLISDMSEEYYNYIKKKIDAYESKEDWKKCIRACDKFLSIYPENKRAVELRGLLYFYKKNLKTK